MNIHWVGPYLPENSRSGADLRSFHLMKGLKKSGATLTGEFLGQHGTDAKGLFDDLTIYSVSSFRRVLRSIGSGVLGNPFTYGKYYHPDLLKGVPEETLIYFDHLHTTVNFRESLEQPVWLDEHNLEFRLWEQYAQRAGGLLSHPLNFEAERVFRYEMSVLADVDGFSIPSSVELNRLPDELSSRGTVVPNGVAPAWLDDGRTRVGQSIGELGTIGFIGKYDWPPNRRGVQQFLDQVWTRLREEVPSMNFVLAGASPPSSWESYDGVETLGYVDRSRDFFNRIDALVVPLDVGAGTRIKVLESLARGVPVIGTEKAVEGIEVDGLRPAPDIEDLHESIVRWRNDLATLGTVRDRAYQVMENRYGWPDIARTLYGAMEDI